MDGVTSPSQQRAFYNSKHLNAHRPAPLSHVFGSFVPVISMGKLHQFFLIFNLQENWEEKRKHLVRFLMASWCGQGLF